MKFENWNTNYKLSLGLAFLLMMWMATGIFSSSKQDDAEDTEEDKRKFSVEVLTSRAQLYKQSAFVRASSEANRSVFVAAEVEGLVVETPAVEGSFVNAGDALCVLESQDRVLRFDQAKAQRDKAEIDYEGALQLKDRGFQSRAQIAAAKASLAVAEAELKASALARDKLVIRAPFDGVVQERLVEAGGFVQRGTHCARFIELSPLIFVGNVSEASVSYLDIGDVAQVKLLGGEKIEGRLRYISRAADPATRTFRVEVEVENPSSSFAEGMSADVTVYTGELMAHDINSSLLSLIGEEKIGVKTLGAGNEVEVTEVTLVGDSEKGVWVTGLADTVTLITVGQEYVDEGAIVNVMNRDDMTSSLPELSTGVSP